MPQQHGGQIFSVVRFYFFLILRTDQAFWLFTSYGNSSLCICLCSLNSDLPIIQTFFVFFFLTEITCKTLNTAEYQFMHRSLQPY